MTKLSLMTLPVVGMGVGGVVTTVGIGAALPCGETVVTWPNEESGGELVRAARCDHVCKHQGVAGKASGSWADAASGLGGDWVGGGSSREGMGWGDLSLAALGGC